MKQFLKDLLWLFVFTMACGVIYLLSMLLFAWVTTWHHWVIIVVAIFFTNALMALPGLFSALLALMPIKTTVGVVLAILNLLYHIVFAIHAVWTSLPPTDGWLIGIDVYATFFFLYLYVMAGIYMLSVHNETINQ